MRIERRYTKDGQIGLRGHRVPAHHQRDPQPGRLGGVQARQCRGPGILVAGRLRRAGAEIFPQGRRARAAEEGRREYRPLVPVALGRRRRSSLLCCPRRSASSASSPPSRCSTGWPAPGPIGAGRAAISTAKRTRRPSSTSCATCWRRRCARPIRRNGSTPACTGPMASTGRARATTTSISRPAS